MPQKSKEVSLISQDKLNAPFEKPNIYHAIIIVQLYDPPHMVELGCIERHYILT